MHRVVEPELLDDLPPADPLALGARGDLRRVNFLMGHAGILTRAFCQHLDNNSIPSQPMRLVELGAGDGTLLLKLARRWSALGITAHVTLLDRRNPVSEETRDGFAAFNWSVESAATDVFVWLEQTSPPVDVMLANLFLHHFQDNSLRALLQLAAAKTNLFIVCEPRRAPLALDAARLLRFIGCNAVTQHDAVVSVRAGFVGNELSTLWPRQKGGWQLNERPAGLFSHCFVAKRNA